MEILEKAKSKEEAQSRYKESQKNRLENHKRKRTNLAEQNLKINKKIRDLQNLVEFNKKEIEILDFAIRNLESKLSKS